MSGSKEAWGLGVRAHRPGCRQASGGGAPGWETAGRGPSTTGGTSIPVGARVDRREATEPLTGHSSSRESHMQPSPHQDCRETAEPTATAPQLWTEFICVVYLQVNAADVNQLGDDFSQYNISFHKEICCGIFQFVF